MRVQALRLQRHDASISMLQLLVLVMVEGPHKRERTASILTFDSFKAYF